MGGDMGNQSFLGLATKPGPGTVPRVLMGNLALHTSTYVTTLSTLGTLSGEAYSPTVLENSAILALDAFSLRYNASSTFGPVDPAAMASDNQISHARGSHHSLLPPVKGD